MKFALRLLGRGAALVALAAIVAAAGPESTVESPLPSAAAGRTLDVSGMDTTAQACTDFYKYGNGGWLEKNPMPSDRPRWGTSDELRLRNQTDLHDILDRLAAGRANAPAGSDEKKLGDFYATCMDETAIESAGLTPVTPELARIDAIRDRDALRAEIGRLQSMGVNALFGFGSEEDRQDSSRMIAAALQAGLGLPDRDYYVRTDAKSADLRKKYVAHVAKTLELAGAAPAKAAADAKTILAFETKLAKASQNNVDFRDPSKTNHPTTLDDLSKANPDLGWTAYFRDQGLPESVTVNVWQPEFFRAADALVKSAPLATWKTYLRWQLLSAAAPTLGRKFVEENFAFNGRTLAGTPEIQPRWKRCVNATDGAMGMALGKIYVAERFPPAAKARMEELVKNLLAAMDEDIQSVSWMGEETKKAARAKAATFAVKIGYPEKWRDYSKLEISPDSYGASVVAANRFEWKRDLAKIGKPLDRSDWAMNPPEVNAQNSSARNEILFPAGILQPPFFYAEGDDAINYGGIGAVIGHEITHSFDNSGRQFDAKGNQVDWWTAEDGRQFDARAKCIIDQYDGYFVEPGLHQNGDLVQGEAIADLGGLAIAYRAYKKSLAGKGEPEKIDGYTGDQRFFISYARIWAAHHRPEFARLLAQTNEHPLGRFRAIGTLANTPEFAQAFGCVPGSAMVRDPACRIW
jgi:endothelin-converting enzyme/putative endopeptidase